MKWNLEELTEDAIADYLRQMVTGNLRVYVAWGMEQFQYPCAVIHVGATEPISESAAWHDARRLNVSIAVCTEAVPEEDDSGNTLRNAREINAEMRSQVLEAVCVSDLSDRLNARALDIAFSMAQVSGTERSTLERRLITTVTLDIIAEPVIGT